MILFSFFFRQYPPKPQAVSKPKCRISAPAHVPDSQGSGMDTNLHNGKVVFVLVIFVSVPNPCPSNPCVRNNFVSEKNWEFFVPPRRFVLLMLRIVDIARDFKSPRISKSIAPIGYPSRRDCEIVSCTIRPVACGCKQSTSSLRLQRSYHRILLPAQAGNTRSSCMGSNYFKNSG